MDTREEIRAIARDNLDWRREHNHEQRETLADIYGKDKAQDEKLFRLEQQVKLLEKQIDYLLVRVMYGEFQGDRNSDGYRESQSYRKSNQTEYFQPEDFLGE